MFIYQVFNSQLMLAARSRTIVYKVKFCGISWFVCLHLKQCEITEMV